MPGDSGTVPDGRIMSSTGTVSARAEMRKDDFATSWRVESSEKQSAYTNVLRHTGVTNVRGLIEIGRIWLVS